jgi:hypothetical protein
MRIQRQQQQTNTLPLIGKIKVGEKATNSAGKEYPKSLDYFRPTGKYVSEFQKVFGDKPDKIGIVFVTDDINEACSQYFACWTDGKMHGKGDGETFRIWDKEADGGKGAYVENVPKTDPRVRALKWDEYTTLKFVIPAIPNVLGYWEFTTKGKRSSIPGIIQAFDFVKNKVGTAVALPFDLVVAKATGRTPGAATSYPVVQLVLNAGEENMTAIKNFLGSGGNINDIATLSLNEGAMKQLSAGTHDVDHEEVK